MDVVLPDPPPPTSEPSLPAQPGQRGFTSVLYLLAVAAALFFGGQRLSAAPNLRNIERVSLPLTVAVLMPVLIYFIGPVDTGTTAGVAAGAGAVVAVAQGIFGGGSGGSA